MQLTAEFQKRSGFLSVLKFSIVLLSLTLIIGTGAATDLNNIESITPSGTNPINITGDLNMMNNNVNNFFGSTCSTGNVVAHINDDGTLDCVDATGEVQNDFVDRSGDSMTGNLDIQGNYITITNSDGDYYLGGSNTPDADTSGVHLETNTNPADGNAIFVVESSGGSERLRVEHSGETSTSNSFDATGFTESGSNTLSNDISGDADTLDGNQGSYYLDNTDSQQLSISGDTISLDNGGSVTISDDQTLSTTADVSGTDDQITIDNGNSITIDDDFEANTNTQLDDQAAQSNVDLNGNNISSVNNLNVNGRITASSGTEPIRVGRASGENSIASNGQSWVGYGGGSNGVLVGYYGSSEVRLGGGSTQVSVRGDLDLNKYNSGFTLPTGADAY